MFYIGQLGRDLNEGEKEVSKEEMKKFVVWKSFYSNPADPRGWVPKIYFWGWTINFRSENQIYIFSSLILIDLLTALSLVFKVCEF